MKKNIILLGSPGAGKGTIAQRFVKDSEYTLITTGDILREQKEADTELGTLLRETIGSGKLVSDDIINRIVENKIKTCTGPFLLDGYPRTTQQAEFLENILSIDLVIYLVVTDKVVTERILERGKTSGRADDQSVEVINRRLEAFKAETQPLVNYYTDIVLEINAENSIDEVFSDFCNCIASTV